MTNGENNSLLIVDDDPANLMELVHILQPYYKIFTAKDGESAIKKAEKLKPDLILLDIVMPDMDGYGVLAEIKKSPKISHIPVIFITGISSLEGEVKGLQCGAVDYIGKPFNETVVKLRVQLHIRIINQMRQIEFLSTTDQLTNIPNRRAFDNRLALEWARSIRDSQEISILLADMDRFKDYNDTYGHQQGDAALLNAARLLGQSLERSTDFCARWGGEEFVVLLPHTDSAGAFTIAEKIRENIEGAIVMLQDGSATKMTISIGINSMVPAQGNPVSKFISGADKALYAAKEAGRNRVVIFDPANENAKTLKIIRKE